MDIEQLRQQMEHLSRNHERVSAEIRELRERTDDIKEIRKDIRLMEQSNARLEERIEQVLIQIENQQKIMTSWKTMIWALLMLLLGGIVAAGFELFKK
jgi:predicted RNase H-like nuclease (RuvC/YqgF family)